MGFLPWDIRVAFHGESQLRQSRATKPTVHAECLSVSIIHRTLTWTTGSLTCTQMLINAIAHGGVRTHLRESALKVDPGRKIPCHTGESNLRQLSQWATSPPQKHAHPHTHLPKHAHTHARAYIHTNTDARAHTHTHTHTYTPPTDDRDRNSCEKGWPCPNYGRFRSHGGQFGLTFTLAKLCKVWVRYSVTYTHRLEQAQ